MGDGLAGDRITRVRAILNGTTNVVLSRMEASRCSLADALSEARALGYAEADPLADLDGRDASAKLAILCALAFGLRVSPTQIATRSTASITADDFARARLLGGTLRQIAHAGFDRATSTLTAWVAPTVVAFSSIFGRTRGPRNAALITGEYSGETGIFGVGAGGAATAVAVISDLDTTIDNLKQAKLIVLPYNPSVPERVADDLAQYVTVGGKLLVFYAVPEKLRPVLQLEGGTHTRAAYPGQFAAIHFMDHALNGAPPVVAQLSWNINAFRPIAGTSRVLAQWFDDKGQSTGHPAILGSTNGLVMTHVMLSDDAAGKQRAAARQLEQFWRSEKEHVVSCRDRAAT
jgi:hypothetical protein